MLVPSTTNRLFLHFCKTGEPRALARVFDRTAPELLRVALYLAGDRNDAEDLVQRTFLAAIESATAYDPERRALPWLLGILGNHARRLQRERALRRRDAGPPQQHPSEDPPTAASHHELRDRIEQLRSDLGTPYAEVLELHLEGLNAKEIAARLGRPAGTVRTQLMRARELLQKNLPAGYVAALLPVLPPPAAGAALASIKAHIVATATATHLALPAAAATHTLATATLSTGAMLMSKKLLFAIPTALLLLAAGIYVRWSQSAPAAPTQAPVEVERADIGRAPGARTSTLADHSAIVRQPSPEVADHDPGFGAVLVEVRWQNGAPAADIGVGAEGLGDVRNERRLAVTAADGTCLLRHLRPGTWRITSTHCKAPLDLQVMAGPPTACTLTAIAAITVTGRVVDSEARPVAGATIWIATGQSSTWQHFALTTSDDLGRFELQLSRDVHIGAEKAAMATSFAVAIDVDAPPSEIVLTLRGPGHRIEGTVRDTIGQPIAWARVHVGPNQVMSRALNGPYDGERFTPVGPETLTDAEGRYAIDGLDPGREHVQAWAAGYAMVSTTVAIESAVTVVDLTMPASAVVYGQVRDATGQPVADAQIAPSWQQGAYFENGTTSDEAGNFRIGNLPLGPSSLTARHGADRASESFDLHAGQTIEWNPQLRRTTAIRGRVLGVDGEPFAGITIAITDAGILLGGPVTETDATGAFELQPDDAGAIDLRLGPLSEPALRLVRGVRPGTDDLVIRLTANELPSARLSGRVVDESGRALLATVSATPAHQAQSHVGETASDGAFVIGPVAAGRYQLSVVTPGHGRRVLPDPVLATGEVRDFGTIVMQTPGSAVVDVLDEQGKPTRGFVALYDERGSWLASAHTDQGRASFRALQPGHYLVVCGGAPFAGHAEFDVTPAGEAITELQLARVGHADLVIVDPHEVAELAVMAFVFAEDGSGGRGAFAGMFGSMLGRDRVRLWLAPGRYIVEVRSDDDRRASATVTIRDLGDHPEVTATLPKR